MLELEGRVLFVSNDEKLCELIVKILRRMNCLVTAATMDMALRKIASLEYDYVLVDCFTNLRTNTELQDVSRCLKQISLLSRNLPVILFTDIASEEGEQVARKQVGGKSYPILSFDSLAKQVMQDVYDKSLSLI